MATYRSFSATPPSVASAADATPIVVGLEFQVTSAANLTMIHWLQPTTGATDASQRTLALYNVTTQTMVGGPWTSAAAGAAGAWVDTTLPTPFALTANTPYRVVVLHPAGEYAATGGYFATGGTGEFPVTTGVLYVPGTHDAVNSQQGSFINSSAMAFPNTTFNGGNYWVDLTVDTGTAAPTVNAGTDQTVSVGSVVTLSGTDSSTTGTITSRQWTFDSYPGGTAPTLTNGATATATFTAATAGTYVARYTVTDNAANTAFDTVNITVPGTTTRPVSTVSLGSWVVTGATDAAAALADESDTTYVTAPDSPATAQTFTVDLGPLVTMSTFSMSLTAWLTATGTGTATVALQEGATTRKTWTLSPTTTAAAVTLSMTSAECATVTSWSALSVAITWGP